MKIQQWLFELLRKQSVTGGRTDGRMDNVKTVYPLQTKFAGGIIIKYVKTLYVITYAILWLFAYCKGGASWMRN